MKLTYENMKKFMVKYFKYYNKYSQDLETCYKMKEFWPEKFKATAYYHRKNGPFPIVCSNGTDFLNIIVQMHQKLEEVLTPLDIIIDEKRKKIGATLSIKKKSRKTGEQYDFTAIAIYQLGLDEENTIKIESLDICVDDPEGITSIWQY